MSYYVSELFGFTVFPLGINLKNLRESFGCYCFTWSFVIGYHSCFPKVLVL